MASRTVEAEHIAEFSVELFLQDFPCGSQYTPRLLRTRTPRSTLDERGTHI